MWSFPHPPSSETRASGRRVSVQLPVVILHKKLKEQAVGATAPQLRAITALGPDLGFGFFMGFSNLFSFLTLFYPPSSSPSSLNISQPLVNLSTSNIPFYFHTCALLLTSLLKGFTAPFVGCCLVSQILHILTHMNTHMRLGSIDEKDNSEPGLPIITVFSSLVCLQIL